MCGPTGTDEHSAPYLRIPSTFCRTQPIKQLADNYWNIRGDFKIAKVINIGTHMSLVKKADGTFIAIDSYGLAPEDQRQLLALTDGGAKVAAVLNVHPFHTVHCKFMQNLLPHARLIGSRRHHEKAPDLRWDAALIEDPETWQEFADVLDFSIPAGVDFISADENVHVSSVIVRHRESGIVHVDDTLMYLDLPTLARKVLPGPKLRFHPRLSAGLEKRAGAADDYMRWARTMAQERADTKIVCAAHKGIMQLTQQTFADAIETALEHVADTLSKHRKTYG